MPSAERFSKTLYSQQYAAVFLVSFGTHVCKFRDAFAMARHHGAKTEKPPAEELGMGNLNGSISQKPCNVLQPRLPKHQLVRPKKKNTLGHQAKGNIHVKALCISNRGPWPRFLLL